MTGGPGLSVVILTYNSEATVGACLESLVRQEYKDFEVIVVDDDSTDDTVAVVSRFASSLQLSVTRNGSHIIPRGRNIGLAQSRAPVVAFLDSDDSAVPNWTHAIIETFREHPETAYISGDLLPAYRTRRAHAIALNDDAIRRLFPSDTAFNVGNSAINRLVAIDAYFDEDFRFAEDLELASRLRGRNLCRHVPGMKIRHYSRDTFAQYAVQMYRYGFMKQYFAFTSGAYRPLDFVPLAIILGGIAASLVLRTWWPLLLILPFSFLEAFVVVCYQRCPALTALFTFPAWLVKNVAWSCGIARGLLTLAVDSDSRRLLRSKRVGHA